MRLLADLRTSGTPFERQLAEKHAARRQVERERGEAVAGRQNAEERLREVMAAHGAQKPATAAQRSTRAEKPSAMPWTIVPATRSADDTATVKQARRRGRPQKARDAGSEFVEWWKPGKSSLQADLRRVTLPPSGRR